MTTRGWLWVAALLAGVHLMLYRRRSRATELLVAKRFTRSPQGIASGAEGFTLEGGPKAVLLLHGFGDTPQSVRSLAEHLHGLGWTVRAPLLPGHGRLLRELAVSRASDWCACAVAEYDELRRGHDPVAVIGQSMGGALAILLAVQRPEIPALVLLAPYLSMLPRVAMLARAHRIVALATPYVRTRSERSILDAAERGRSLGAGFVPPRALAELRAVTLAAAEAATRVRVPTLVLQSTSDHRIAAADAARAFERLGAECKSLQWLSGRGHVIAVDHGRETVFAMAEDWLRRHGTL